MHDALAARLAVLARRKQIAPQAAASAAKLLVSIAHDWALRTLFAHQPLSRRERELKEVVAIVWKGLRPKT